MSEPTICPSCGQPVRSAEQRVRDGIRLALAEQNVTQAELAERLGTTQKHLSALLNGRSQLTFEWAERMLAVVGQTLTVAIDNPAGAS